jgi:hypothetical protein
VWVVRCAAKRWMKRERDGRVDFPPGVCALDACMGPFPDYFTDACRVCVQILRECQLYCRVGRNSGNWQSGASRLFDEAPPPNHITNFHVSLVSHAWTPCNAKLLISTSRLNPGPRLPTCKYPLPAVAILLPIVLEGRRGKKLSSILS